MADDPGTERRGPPGHPLAIAAIASGGAAVLHAAASGIHAEHAGLARLFIALAVAQAGAAVLGFVRTDRWACASLAVVNGGAAAGWLVTRLTGISWIGGLEVAERPQIADTTAAALALVAVAAAVSCLAERAPVLPARAVTNAAVLAGILVVPGLADATTHDHGAHVHDAAADESASAGSTSDAHVHDATADESASAGSTSDAHVHDDSASAGSTTDHDHGAVDPATSWPRPWDPTAPIDFSGVAGVSPEQQARAEQLVAATLRDLPAFADVSSVGALGYRSIGDAGTGFEHYVNTALIGDDKFLDPTAPESLVYEVDGDDRTLVSAMFIADRTPIDDPSLTGYAGPLMQWHVHDDLCWGLDDQGVPVVKGVLENFGGTCPPGTVNTGGENPMVHVWIAPHECGPFAALEGHGAGQAGVSEGARMDQCQHDHDAATADDHAGHEAAAVATKPYDPELPIDLGGVDGVTLQQQAFAENLVASTVRDLPQWADLDVVAAAGFHSIGDAATGHEHYIQWDWIDDDVWLDPDHPESLVFEPQPDGSKRLVSAMFMLPSDMTLDDVPDWGGALMQWHVHGDLCFTDDPVAPRVAGLKPIGTTCAPPLVDGTMAPMIHVWIRPHECGPFAALEGIGGGQVPTGETVLCDHAHGA
jgi:hypothetical protein